MKTLGYIRATFIGENGSMGFGTRTEYPLEIIQCGFWERLSRGYDFAIIRRDTGTFCPYKNIMTFLMNWKIK